jgi:hypothetical protein
MVQGGFWCKTTGGFRLHSGLSRGLLLASSATHLVGGEVVVPTGLAAAAAGPLPAKTAAFPGYVYCVLGYTKSRTFGLLAFDE